MDAGGLVSGKDRGSGCGAARRRLQVLERLVQVDARRGGAASSAGVLRGFWERC
jgi:hypothetical protein